MRGTKHISFLSHSPVQVIQKARGGLASPKKEAKLMAPQNPPETDPPALD